MGWYNNGDWLSLPYSKMGHLLADLCNATNDVRMALEASDKVEWVIPGIDKEAYPEEAYVYDPTVDSFRHVYLDDRYNRYWNEHPDTPHPDKTYLRDLLVMIKEKIEDVIDITVHNSSWSYDHEGIILSGWLKNYIPEDYPYTEDDPLGIYEDWEDLVEDCTYDWNESLGDGSTFEDLREQMLVLKYALDHLLYYRCGISISLTGFSPLRVREEFEPDVEDNWTKVMTNWTSTDGLLQYVQFHLKASAVYSEVKMCVESFYHTFPGNYQWTKGSVYAYSSEYETEASDAEDPDNGKFPEGYSIPISVSDGEGNIAVALFDSVPANAPYTTTRHSAFEAIPVDDFFPFHVKVYELPGPFPVTYDPPLIDPCNWRLLPKNATVHIDLRGILQYAEEG